MSDDHPTTSYSGVNQLKPLQAALYYSTYAKVFPLQPGTKIPLFPGSLADPIVQRSVELDPGSKHGTTSWRPRPAVHSFP